MRVCEVTPYGLAEVSGVTRVVVDLARELGKRGHPTAVVAPAAAASAAGYDPWPIVLTGPFRNVRFSQAVVSLLLRRRRDWDLVHVHQAHLASLAAAVTARVLGRPAVATLHSKPGDDPGLRSATERTAQRMLPAYCSELAFVSASTRDAFGANGRVIHNGIDVEEVRKALGARTALRQSLGLDGFVVLYSGRRAASKGYLDLLAAVRAARDANADVRLLTLGEEPEQERVAHVQRVKELQLDSFVTDLGGRDDSVRYFSAADALALPSYREGLPIVILEGLAAGLPILACRVGGIPEVIEDGREGFLVPAGDVAALTDRILRLARDPSLAADLGRAASKRAADFKLSRTVDAYLGMYERATNIGTGGGNR